MTSVSIGSGECNECILSSHVTLLRSIPLTQCYEWAVSGEGSRLAVSGHIEWPKITDWITHIWHRKLTLCCFKDKTLHLALNGQVFLKIELLKLCWHNLNSSDWPVLIFFFFHVVLSDLWLYAMNKVRRLQSYYSCLSTAVFGFYVTFALC